jgi:ankyrin repeat protein
VARYFVENRIALFTHCRVRSASDSVPAVYRVDYRRFLIARSYFFSSFSFAMRCSHQRLFLRVSAVLLFAFACSGAVAQESLADLIQRGRSADARALVEAGADVNSAQADGTTPLHWAVYRLDTALVDLLLERGAQPDVTNAYGSSPLSEAINAANTGLVLRLLEAGADVESPNLDGQTALMLAARVGSLWIARALIDNGAAVNARETWRNQTALMWAADTAAADVVTALIAAGADVRVRAATNEWSAQITSEPRAQYRPTGGLTALLYAARSGCTACIDSILDAGATIDRPNPDGVTALMIALDNARFGTAMRLIERGANPHVWDWWGRTALYVAADASSYNRRSSDPAPQSEVSAAEIAALLLEAGVDPNPQLNMHRPSRGGNIGRFVDDLLTTGATPLLRAAIGHDVPFVQLLLEHGAYVDLPNVMGVTPLMGAAGVGISRRDRAIDTSGDVQRRAIRALELLVAAGADVNARIVSTYNRSARIARPSTMTEREGQTALFGAVKWGWADVAQFLLEHGADATLRDERGFTSVDAALGRTGGRDNTVSDDIATLLQAHIAAH